MMTKSERISNIQKKDAVKEGKFLMYCDSNLNRDGMKGTLQKQSFASNVTTNEQNNS